MRGASVLVARLRACGAASRRFNGAEPRGLGERRRRSTQEGETKMLLQRSRATRGHDSFGNRTRKTEGTQVTQYVYDGVGGLLSATLPDSTRLEYVIDSRGRRVGKKRNGTLEKGWLYDGQLRIVAELDGTGAVVSRFIYGTSSHSPDIMLRGGVTFRYVHDVLGSVRLVINVATGQVAQRVDYDSWGVITSDSIPGFQPFGLQADSLTPTPA